VPLIRTVSLQSGSRVDAFRDAVRSRDGRCVATGKKAVNVNIGRWKGFQVAHIFPLAYETYWKANNYGDFITIPPAKRSDGSINSIQNGLLLSTDVHEQFDSINLDVCIPFMP